LARGRLRTKIPVLPQALTGVVREHHRRLLAIQLAHVDFLDEQIATLSEEIRHVLSTLCPSEPPGSTTDDAGATPTVPEASPSIPPMTFLRAITLLDSLPDVNQPGAELLVAEWGIDMECMGTVPRLAARSGLAPGNNESVSIQRSGKTRQGNRALRPGLVQMAHAAAHTKDTYLSALSHRLAARRGKKRAIVAVAHSMVRSAFHRLSRHEPYHELGDNYCDQHRREHRVDRLTRRIERPRYRVALEPAVTS
jgi:transposase